MKLASIIHEDHILIDQLTGDKNEAIVALFEHLAAGGDEWEALPEVDRQAALAEILQREELLSSYVGNGVAIPHAKIDNLQCVRIGLATSRRGVSAGLPAAQKDEPTGADGKPPEKIHLMFLILAPGGQNTLMLQALAAVARLCHSKDNRDALRQIKLPSRIIKTIEETGIEVKSTICAGDIMQRDITPLRPEMVVAEAVKLMAAAGCDVLPALDEKGAVAGELSSAELIKVGLPDYVELLSDETFLSNFEPFEQYFNQRMKLTVGELMDKQPIVLPSNTPITKVAHELIDRGRISACIEDDHKFVGVIFRQDFLTRVLQL